MSIDGFVLIEKVFASDVGTKSIPFISTDKPCVSSVGGACALDNPGVAGPFCRDRSECDSLVCNHDANTGVLSTCFLFKTPLNLGNGNQFAWVKIGRVITVRGTITTAGVVPTPPPQNTQPTPPPSQPTNPPVDPAPSNNPAQPGPTGTAVDPTSTPQPSSADNSVPPSTFSSVAFTSTNAGVPRPTSTGGVGGSVTGPGAGSTPTIGVPDGSSSSSSQLGTGVIIGLAVGGVLVIALVAVVAMVVVMRKRKTAKQLHSVMELRVVDRDMNVGFGSGGTPVPGYQYNDPAKKDMQIAPIAPIRVQSTLPRQGSENPDALADAHRPTVYNPITTASFQDVKQPDGALWNSGNQTRSVPLPGGVNVSWKETEMMGSGGGGVVGPSGSSGLPAYVVSEEHVRQGRLEESKSTYQP
ncbi:hypothetical protein HDU97_006149 [Phlyctochytrium planicorne]|nr:hypothetical protein HDU97_006149 [Phlyctochytrium planicorne]